MTGRTPRFYYYHCGDAMPFPFSGDGARSGLDHARKKFANFIFRMSYYVRERHLYQERLFLQRLGCSPQGR
jgi:hypothetical protein